MKNGKHKYLTKLCKDYNVTFEQLYEQKDDLRLSQNLRVELFQIVKQSRRNKRRNHEG